MSKHHKKLGGEARRKLRKIRDKLSLAQNHKCYYCQKQTIKPTSSGFSPNWATLEHVERLSSNPNASEFVMLCMECNSKQVNINKEELNGV